jgi:predicted amidohydrolase
MASDFRVAIVQETRDPHDCAANVDKGLRLVRQAAAQGADVVLFPECWITGYAFPDAADPAAYVRWADGALDEDSPHLQAFCRVAAELDVGIVITAFARGTVRPRNSAFLIDRQGRIALRYDKVHTCDFDAERLVEGGREFKVADLDGVKIGLMICYDREYPESARILMLKGAELILVPNDCGTMPPRLRALSTRAYENMVGVAMANPPGRNAGCSCAFSPIVWDSDERPVDNTIVLADELTPGIFVAAYDLDALRDYRRREMLGNTFRKVEAYAGLLDAEVHEPFIRAH